MATTWSAWLTAPMTRAEVALLVLLDQSSPTTTEACAPASSLASLPSRALNDDWPAFTDTYLAAHTPVCVPDAAADWPAARAWCERGSNSKTVSSHAISLAFPPLVLPLHVRKAAVAAYTESAASSSLSSGFSGDIQHGFAVLRAVAAALASPTSDASDAGAYSKWLSAAAPAAASVCSGVKPRVSALLHHAPGSDECVSVVECGQRDSNAQARAAVPLQAYISEWESATVGGGESKWPEPVNGFTRYLRDWHWVNGHPAGIAADGGAGEGSVPAYTLPPALGDDWINELWDWEAGRDTLSFKTVEPLKNSGEDSGVGAHDFRFLYLGPQGSWTPLHRDVFGSFSWSANIAGAKLWLFWTPSAAALLGKGPTERAASDAAATGEVEVRGPQCLFPSAQAVLTSLASPAPSSDEAESPVCDAFTVFPSLRLPLDTSAAAVPLATEFPAAAALWSEWGARARLRALAHSLINAASTAALAAIMSPGSDDAYGSVELVRCAEAVTDALRSLHALPITATIQHPNCLIVVPPLYAHEVHNLSPCLSLNHNWAGPSAADAVADQLARDRAAADAALAGLAFKEVADATAAAAAAAGLGDTPVGTDLPEPECLGYTCSEFARSIRRTASFRDSAAPSHSPLCPLRAPVPAPAVRRTRAWDPEDFALRQMLLRANAGADVPRLWRWLVFAAAAAVARGVVLVWRAHSEVTEKLVHAQLKHLATASETVAAPDVVTAAVTAIADLLGTADSSLGTFALSLLLSDPGIAFCRCPHCAHAPARAQARARVAAAGARGGKAPQGIAQFDALAAARVGGFQGVLPLCASHKGSAVPAESVRGWRRAAAASLAAVARVSARIEAPGDGDIAAGDWLAGLADTEFDPLASEPSAEPMERAVPTVRALRETVSRVLEKMQRMWADDLE